MILTIMKVTADGEGRVPKAAAAKLWDLGFLSLFFFLG
jgi:hypothetical protein